jgi:hypothetical protein
MPGPDARLGLPPLWCRVRHPKSSRRYLPTRVPAPEAVLQARSTRMAPGAWGGETPYAVYLIECQSAGTYYIGISRGDILANRLRRHWDDSFLDGTVLVGERAEGHGKLAPNETFMMIHGYRATLEVVLVPGKAAAEELECDWAYSLAANARVVFGRGITATCPGTGWLNGFGGVPWWDRNTVKGPDQAVSLE